MTWGNFTSPHILSLIISVFLNIILYFLIRFKSKQFQTIILTSLSFFGLLAIIYNLLMWNSPLEYLPLHLCSLNAIILPFAIISKNDKLGNLLILWSLGALIALIINNSAANFKIISFTFFFYLPDGPLLNQIHPSYLKDFILQLLFHIQFQFYCCSKLFCSFT